MNLTTIARRAGQVAAATARRAMVVRFIVASQGPRCVRCLGWSYRDGYPYAARAIGWQGDSPGEREAAMDGRTMARRAALAALAIMGLAAGPARADGPGVGTPWVVTVGDSYISGEAGRWAGNTHNGEV